MVVFGFDVQHFELCCGMQPNLQNGRQLEWRLRWGDQLSDTMRGTSYGVLGSIFDGLEALGVISTQSMTTALDEVDKEWGVYDSGGGQLCVLCVVNRFDYVSDDLQNDVLGSQRKMEWELQVSKRCAVLSKESVEGAKRVIISVSLVHNVLV